MLRKFLTGVFCALVVLASQSGAFAQNSQTFNVVVPSVITITAPSAVSINHNQTDANQVFPVQAWSAKCNNGIGGTVSFSTNNAFLAVVNGTTYKRHAQLNLAVGSADAGSGWNTLIASDTTTASDEVATVSAVSLKPGDATLNLTMTFLDTDFSVLPAATFALTVTATISAN